MEMLVLLAALIAIAVAAPRYGVDSRGSGSLRQSNPIADLAALRRTWVRRVRRVRARR